MARSGRAVSELGIYHVLLRGTNVLFLENADFDEFVRLLEKYSKREQIKLFSYALLKNRVHLVVHTEDSVGRALKPLCTSYARYVNRTYSREGKLFYDRMKSEPIKSEDELKNAVAFVNYLGAREGVDYAYCSAFSDNEICGGEELTEAERRNCKLVEMFMEDYDCLSQEELDDYIKALCGVTPAEFKELSQEERQSALGILTRKKWIAGTKLYGILGMKKPRGGEIKKNAPKTSAVKKEEKKEKKEELSFWLL